VSAATTVGSDLADILRQVKRLELRTNRLVSALAAGRYRSAFRGQGMEFDEVREYSPGDDIRSIDWNVTARAGRPYVKVFREERELTTMLLVDASASMRFGAIPGISARAKLSLAAEAAAIIGITALRNHDRIGLMLYSRATDLHLPARKGRGHALRLVREVLAVPGRQVIGGGTDLSAALDELARVAVRRAVVFVISDFLPTGGGVAPRLGSSLARLGRRHDVVGLRVSDPAESRLPAGREPVVIEDPEGGEQIVLRGGSRSRARYSELYQANRLHTDEQFRAAGCDLVDLTTDASAITALTRFFRDRRRRMHG
jgi:uncharacterized protein (DUF58 family)